MPSKNELILSVIEELLSDAHDKVMTHYNELQALAEKKVLTSAPIKKLTQKLDATHTALVEENERHKTALEGYMKQEELLKQQLTGLGIRIGRDYNYDALRDAYRYHLTGTDSTAKTYLDRQTTQIKRIRQETNLAVASARAPELLAIVDMVKEALRDLES